MNLVEITGVSKRFGSFQAVGGVSLSIAPGEVVGLLGANGAGKTTMMRMLCGLIKPDNGTIRINGRLGYMCQSFSLIEELTVKENIQFYGALQGLSNATVSEREATITQALKLGPYMSKRATELPSGWRQALSFSIAVIHNPSVLVLDEPTSGLDSISRRRLWNMIREKAAGGTAVIVSTHYLDEAFFCDRLAIMKEGRLICEGPTGSIASSRNALIDYFK